MIPNKFHCIFGLKEDFGGKPFSLVHYLAIKSAIIINNPLEVNFYYKYEPTGDYWHKIKPYLKLHQIEPPTEIFGNPLLHMSHQAGVLRLKYLIEQGGIYLDCDTICIKPFSPLLNNNVVLGIQGEGNRPEGLCDAVILSEKDSIFLKIWLDSYKTHRSKGRDVFWAEHAVIVPLQLSYKHQNDISVMPYDFFHYPLYHPNGINDLFNKNISFPNAFCHHLWEQISWEKHLSKLTENYIKTVDTTYNLIARKYL